VEDDLRREYSSGVFYGEDAFAGLRLMEDLTSGETSRSERISEGRKVKSYAKAAVAEVAAAPAPARPQRVEIPKPPFLGARVEKNFDLPGLFEYINETALFKNQWQLKTASQEDYARLVKEKFRPILEELKQEVLAAGWFEPKAVYGYFLCEADGNDLVIYDRPEGAQPGTAVPHGSRCYNPRP